MNLELIEEIKRLIGAELEDRYLYYFEEIETADNTDDRVGAILTLSSVMQSDIYYIIRAIGKLDRLADRLEEEA